MHKQNFVCWPLNGPQDSKQTYILMEVLGEEEKGAHLKVEEEEVRVRQS